MKAYLVVTVNSGKSRDVARVISSLPGVIMADACWGVGDVFAVLEFSSWSDLNHVVLEKIHQTPNVIHTETNVAIQD
jgi:DNA-binding Lrp family transcriptional regulator